MNPARSFAVGAAELVLTRFQYNVFSVLLKESVDLGEIMFSLCYLPTAGRLTLTVIKCRNLKAMDITGYSGGCSMVGRTPLQGRVVSETSDNALPVF